MDSAGGDSPLMGVCSFCFLPQERISYIGPEEFVQAFVQKDPLDNDKVASDFRCGRERPNQKKPLQLEFVLHVASGDGGSLVTLPDRLADAQVRARARDCCSKGSQTHPRLIC